MGSHCIRSQQSSEVMQASDKWQLGTDPKLSVELLRSSRYSHNYQTLELTGGGSCSSAAAAAATAAQSSAFQTAARCQSCQEIESSHPDSCCFTPASARQRERASRANVLTPSLLSEPRRRQRAAGRNLPGFTARQHRYYLEPLLFTTASPRGDMWGVTKLRITLLSTAATLLSFLRWVYTKKCKSFQLK